MKKNLSQKLKDLKEELEQAGQILNKINHHGFDVFNFFDLCNDLLSVSFSDGYFKLVNSAWTRATGFTSEELLSKPWIEFVHPEDVEKSISFIKEEKNTINFINRYITKDGKYIMLSWNTKIDDNGIAYVCATVIA